ncbi:MAG: dipeptidase [Bacteroidales bacterium]|nr:dipeptidase [Bacteroidales bacterium]
MNRIFRLLMLAAIIVAGCNRRPAIYSDEEITRIHQSLYTIDSHTDTPLLLMIPGTDLSRKNQVRPELGKIDIPRMDEGGLDGLFFAVFVGQGERTGEGNLRAREKALAIFDSIHAFIDRNPEKTALALRAGDLQKISKSGRHAVYIGMENGYTLGNDLSMIGEYYRLGARYITLCHSSNNDICDSSTDRKGPEHDGLSRFGREVVKEMNRLGMMIDVSHISDKAFFDVLETTRVPVIASHSCTRAICNHPRNLTDDMLKALAANGGVIQVCLVSDYVKEMEGTIARDSAKDEVIKKHGDYFGLDDAAQKAFLADWYAVDSIYPVALATVSDLVDHIDHIVHVAGIGHVGIGTDFDGGAELEDCYDVTALKNITAELLERGYTRADIRKIWSGNLLRVMNAVKEAKNS